MYLCICFMFFLKFTNIKLNKLWGLLTSPNKDDRIEYDQTMTTTNLNNWTWQKLKPANLLKLTNLNYTSGVLLIYVPDVFFLVEGQREAWQVSQPVRAGAGGSIQADRTSIFFWRQVNIRRCLEIWSSSKSKVCWCKNFSVIF